MWSIFEQIRRILPLYRALFSNQRLKFHCTLHASAVFVGKHAAPRSKRPKSTRNTTRDTTYLARTYHEGVPADQHQQRGIGRQVCAVFCVCTCIRRWQCAQYITWLFMDKR